MDKIEWPALLVTPLAAVRLLQDAANMLNGREFVQTQGWVWNDYSRHKFEEFQEIGRLLSHFDDGVIVGSMAAYRRLHTLEGASQAVPVCSECGQALSEHPAGVGCLGHDDFCFVNCTDPLCSYEHKCKVCDAAGVTQGKAGWRA